MQPVSFCVYDRWRSQGGGALLVVTPPLLDLYELNWESLFNFARSLEICCPASDELVVSLENILSFSCERFLKRLIKTWGWGA